MSKKFIKKNNTNYFLFFTGVIILTLISCTKFDLERIGISSSNIIVSDWCTFENKRCHSFRRDGENAGRMSFIAYKGVK